MSIIRIQIFALLLLLSIFACAKSNTRLGCEEYRNQESFQDGGARSDLDRSSDSASSSNGDEPDQSVVAEDSTQDRIPVIGFVDAGIDGPPPIITIQPPTIVVVEDPETRQNRLDLISEYCSLLERFPCLVSSYSDYYFETVEEEVRFCTLETEFEHYKTVTTLSGSQCESEWEAVLRCAIDYDYTCPCSGDECTLVPGLSRSPSFPCQEASEAFSYCLSSVVGGYMRDFHVTGEQRSCNGYIDLMGDPMEEDVCEVSCDDFDEGDNWYEFRCKGPLEGPYECTCMINEILLSDAFPNSSTGREPRELILDCETATRLMAEGRCHDITDCCITWTSETGSEACGCTADPTRSMSGATTCEELADTLDGEVVDLCPQYMHYDSTFPIY